MASPKRFAEVLFVMMERALLITPQAGKPRLAMKAAVDRGTMVGSRKLASHALVDDYVALDKLKAIEELSSKLTAPTEVLNAATPADSKAVVFVTRNVPVLASPTSSIALLMR